jgi:hypothetical protein
MLETIFQLTMWGDESVSLVPVDWLKAHEEIRVKARDKLLDMTKIRALYSMVIIAILWPVYSICQVSQQFVLTIFLMKLLLSRHGPIQSMIKSAKKM